MMKNNVKFKLIKTGAQALLEKGYHAVGLNEILAEAQVPKGSFYYYFRSKEDFCVAIIDYYIEKYKASRLYILADSSLPARERLLRFFSSERSYFLERQCQQGCLLVKLVMEMSSLSSVIRIALQHGINEWIKAIIICLNDGKNSGEFPVFRSPEVMANLVYSSWIGAITCMQVNQSIEPLDIFLDYLSTEIGECRI